MRERLVAALNLDPIGLVGWHALVYEGCPAGCARLGLEDAAFSPRAG